MLRARVFPNVGFVAFELYSRLAGLRAVALRERGAVEKMQLQKFRRFLSRVVAGSPWYASQVRDLGLAVEEARPEDFPVLTKAQLMDHFDDIVTRRDLSRERIERFLERSKNPAELLDGKYVVVHTSGTSGRLGYCAYSREEWLRGWVMLSRAAAPSSPTRTAFVAAVRGHYAGVTLCVSPAFIPWSLCGLRLWFRARLFDINDPWEKTLAGLDRYQPNVLAGYGSAVRELALAQREGLLHIRPRLLICGGDAIGADGQALASESFGAPLYNLYSTTETMVLGIAGPGEEMVLCEDDLILEIREDHLLVTNLLNETTPLIRYRLDDTLIGSPDDGSARRRYPGFRRVRGVVGRSEERIVLLNEAGIEDSIHPIVVAEFFVRGAEGFRAVRRSRTNLLIEARPASGLAQPSREELVREIRAGWTAILSQKGMLNVVLEVRLVDTLAVDPRTGKFRLVTCEG